MNAAGYSSQRGSNSRFMPLPSCQLGYVSRLLDCLCRRPSSIFLLTGHSYTGCWVPKDNWSDFPLPDRSTRPMTSYFAQLTQPTFALLRARPALAKECFLVIRLLLRG